MSFTETDESAKEKNVWNTNETLALIESYRCHKNEFTQSRKRKMVWVKISTFLLGLQVMKLPKACEVKWKKLVRTYKNVKDNNNKTGRGVSRFTFYDQMDEILGDKPSTSCDHTFNAGAESCINEVVEGSESTETQLYVSEESTDSQRSDSETPIKRRRVNYYQELLKTKTEMMIQQNQYEKQKAIDRERKNELKKQERGKKKWNYFKNNLISKKEKYWH
ncbi:hypothetical protein CBL_03763 [Carabus blaptoides fortunei]